MKTTLITISTVSRTLCKASTGSAHFFGSCCWQDLYELHAKKKKKKKGVSSDFGFINVDVKTLINFGVATSVIRVYIQEISDI